LYRQSQIFAPEGIELECSILARWVGEVTSLLEPVAEVLRRYVLDTDKLHGDYTPYMATPSATIDDVYVDEVNVPRT
jgi:transposase